MKPYEVAYDIEFNIFAEGILEDIAHKVINENSGIDIQKIPEIVSEYNIKYAEQRIEFNYLLDYSQVISEYYSKTGKEPYYETSEINLEMNIQMFKDNQHIEKITFLDNLPSCEDYKNEYMLGLRGDALFCGCLCALLYCIIWFLALESLYNLSEKWEKKHELS